MIGDAEVVRRNSVDAKSPRHVSRVVGPGNVHWPVRVNWGVSFAFDRHPGTTRYADNCAPL